LLLSEVHDPRKPDIRNTIAIAKQLEKAGLSRLVIQAQTRTFDKTHPDVVKKIAKELHIPVTYNGLVLTLREKDLKRLTPDDKRYHSAEGLLNFFANSGVDQIMVSRVLLGSPWALGGDVASDKEVLTAALRHSYYMTDSYLGMGLSGLIYLRIGILFYIRYLTPKIQEKLRDGIQRAKSQKEIIILLKNAKKKAHLATMGKTNPSAVLDNNPWLRHSGIYRNRGPHNLFLDNIREPIGAPFKIYRTDIRNYSLDAIKAGGIHPWGSPVYPVFSTVTYHTKSKEPLDTEDAVISYVKSLLDFVQTIGKIKISVIIKDNNEQKFRQILWALCKTYSNGMVVAPGCKHAYRQVDLGTPLGNKIRILATYLNRGYGYFNERGRDQAKFPSDIFVDEEGHLFLCRTNFGDFGYNESGFDSSEFYSLAYLLGKDIANVVETRFPLLDELEQVITDDMRIVFEISKKLGRDRVYAPFQRVVSDYRKEELFIQDAKKARAARIVWLLWMGIYDPHFHNSQTVDGVAIDFDFNSILSPFEHVRDIDMDRYTSLMVYYFLLTQTEEMDPLLLYRRI
jgi:hypothetical protein